MSGAVPAGGPAIMGHCAAGDSGESCIVHSVILPITHTILSTIHLQPSLLGKYRKRMGWSHIFVHIHVIISPMDHWPALTLPLSWLLDCCPAPSKATSIYLFLIWRQRLWQDKIQDVNQWQGDRDLEQEPDADITPDSVIMQCVARQVSRQETGQTVTQWYTGPQGWCWEIRSWGRCHPDGGWRVTSPPSHLTFIYYTTHADTRHNNTTFTILYSDSVST